jgi:ligand-binding sensor domain-containing protein
MTLNHRRLICVLVISIAVLSSHILHAQGFVPTYYTSKSGIGHDNVRTIVADSSGFIWMATWDGLTRYDGTDFVNYFHDPADSTSLPYFSVSHIEVDCQDNLWVSTDNGILSLFDRTTEEFRTVRSLGGVMLDDLAYFKNGPDGYIWLLLRKGILRYHPVTTEALFQPWRAGDHEIPDMPHISYRMTFADNGSLWLIGRKILQTETVLDTASGDYYATIKGIYPLERLPGRIGTFFTDAGMARIVNDSDGNIWLTSLSGLFRLDPKKGVFSEHGDTIRKISFEYDEPLAYYNHDSGLKIWLPENDSVITIPATVCAMPTACFFLDPGMLWVARSLEGGTPAGVVKIILTPSEFRHINPLPQSSSELNVFGIIRDVKGGLWLAARDRNYLIRIGPDGTPEKINVLNEKDQVGLWHPRSFLPDTGGLWIGYYFQKLIRYDFASGTIEEHFPARWVHTMCHDGQGNILIADAGIVSYDPVSRNSVRLLEVGDSLNVFTMHREGNILWAGCSYSYLIKYDLSTGKHEYIRIARGMTNIEDICKGRDGILWLATLGSGVCRFDTSTGGRIYYTTATGLSNNTTYSLLRDYAGNVWVSTNHGISVINHTTGMVRSFGENDGLMINEFNSDASWVTGDGKFLFGGVGGAVEFDPAEVMGEQAGRAANKIIVLELEVSALRRVLGEPIYRTDTITLRKGDDNFHLSFVVPEYRHPDMIRYRYRLGGESYNWYYTDHNDRNINFSNLRPGWHNLDIQATDADGLWSISKNLVIRIKPRYYQTTAFLVITPLFVLIILGVLGWNIFRQFRNREQQKRDMLRQQALRGQMNPHFIFNALNSINYFISNNDRLSANRYIADFSKLIRNVLNNMNEDFVKLSAEIGALTDYLKIEHLRFGDKFDYCFRIEEGLQPEAFRVSPGLIQPFVENAIWHGVMGLYGRKGSITVDFRMREGILVCTVEDDGVGRLRSEAVKDKSLLRRSKGISLATDRLKIINSLMLSNYKLSITDLYPDRNETGTRVEIELPVAV